MAFLTEHEAMRAHFWTGHAILAVIFLRALIGLYGSEHVRFESFIPAPRAFFSYFGDLIRGRAGENLGHDPAGGAMIATLLTLLLLTVATGLANYYMPALEETLEEVHETLAHVVLFLAIVHVLGVSVSSYLQRQNLIGAMLTGWKVVRDEPNTAEDNHE
jgi:cytochrome b